MVSRMHPAGSVAASVRGGLSGYTVSVNGKTTEFYEISWQDRVIMLNQKKLFERIWGGLIASGSWLINVGVLRALARNRIWLMWFLVSSVLMGFWFYGIIAVVFVAVGNFQTAPLATPALIGAGLSVLKSNAGALGKWMQGWWIWVFVTAAFAVAGLRPDFIADLADLMQRYLSNSKDDDPAGLYALAERLRQLVYDAATTLPGFSGEEVLIVGHSFGTLLAVDAVADGLPNKVSLMTLGTLFPFLTARKADLQATVEKCANSPSLTRWDDYYAAEDWFGNSSPLSITSSSYHPHAVTMGVPFYKRFTLTAHHSYYRNLTILNAMLA